MAGRALLVDGLVGRLVVVPCFLMGFFVVVVLISPAAAFVLLLL